VLEQEKKYDDIQFNIFKKRNGIITKEQNVTPGSQIDTKFDNSLIVAMDSLRYLLNGRELSWYY
jgi:hypothetical protein